MFTIHDRTRRFWTFVLFMAGGPLLTFLIIMLLWFRNGDAAVQWQEESLANTLRVPVSIGDVRFLRPRETQLFGCELQDPQTNQTAIFCPRIAIAPLNGKNGAKRKTDHPEFAHLDEKDFERGASLVTIPQIYVRYSSIPRLKKIVSEFLQRVQQGSVKNIVCFETDNLTVFYSDADFQQVIDDYLRKSRKEKRSEPWTDQQNDIPFDTLDASAESIQRWMKRYNDESMSARLTDLFAYYKDDATYRRLDLSFRFASIPMESPVVFSWAYEKERADTIAGTSQITLGCDKVPVPCSFASMFCPFFFIAGTESWMTGTIAVEKKYKDATSLPETTLRFDDFHLKRCDITPAAKRITSRHITGTVADFALESAKIEQGVFTGNGSLFLIDGTLEKQFLMRLAETIPLRFEPESMLAHQYKGDEVPFDQFAVSFDFKTDGVQFSSSYPRKIIGFFRNDRVEYGIYLPERPDSVLVSYPKLVGALATQPDVVPSWSPVYRDAIRHLPVNK